MASTTHGHHITGTDFEGEDPLGRMRCGGPGLCHQCSREAYLAVINNLKPLPIMKDTTVITTQKFARKRFEVDAVQVTAENMKEVADWCLGQVQQDQGVKFIKVNVSRPMNDNQTKGFVGCWILHAGGGFKVYTDKAFKASFDVTPDAPRQMKTTSEKLAVVATTSHAVKD